MAKEKIQGMEWTATEIQFLNTLTTPYQIQQYLDTLEYSADSVYRSPRSVINDKKAHCFDGALFAAAALKRLGFQPLIIDMTAQNDDDHILAVFKVDSCWGAIAKSNFAGLRFREPVYKTLRELVMSYFELYFNTNYQKTLRGYTLPLNLKQFDKYNWRFSDDYLELIADKLDELQVQSILTKKQLQNLQLIDERSYQSGLAGANSNGLYKPA